MSPIRILVAAAWLFAAGAACAEVRIVPQDSGVKVRLRGISAVSADVAWASGREGTVLRTVDGGKHWQTIKVPDAGELDFRDVEGFDADTAVVLSIGPGEASRVYRTEDGGKSWKFALQNKDPRAFFDCMAFQGTDGWMLGDPIEGRFQVYRSRNAGKDWQLTPNGPKAVDGEAAFAASGTCIAATNTHVVVVTGGDAARAHVLNVGTNEWYATEPAKSKKSESSGFFSAASSGNHTFLLVGGDYKSESKPGLIAGLSFAKKNGAGIASLAELDPPLRGYRSAIACGDRFSSPCIAVGPSGVEAENAQPSHIRLSLLSGTGYDAIDLAGSIGWMSGDGGRIARVEISD